MISLITSFKHKSIRVFKKYTIDFPLAALILSASVFFLIINISQNITVPKYLKIDAIIEFAAVEETSCTITIDQAYRDKLTPNTAYKVIWNKESEGIKYHGMLYTNVAREDWIIEINKNDLTELMSKGHISSLSSKMKADIDIEYGAESLYEKLINKLLKQ